MCKPRSLSKLGTAKKALFGRHIYYITWTPYCWYQNSKTLHIPIQNAKGYGLGKNLRPRPEVTTERGNSASEKKPLRTHRKKFS